MTGGREKFLASNFSFISHIPKKYHLVIIIREQGVLIDCVYCKYIKPELQGTKDCPQCHGKTPTFKPMRMMDRLTSEQDILQEILDLQFKEHPDLLYKSLLNLLSRMEVYNFDLKSAIIQFLQNSEPTP